MNQEAVRIRSAGTEDIQTIVGFNAAMALETEHRMLDLDRLREGARALLAHPQYGFYIVAEASCEESQPAVGQLMVTFEWSDWRNGVFWWIQSVYVTPEWRRQGVYRAMHKHIAAQAKADPHVCGIRLYVEQQNHRAQAVYRSVGLTPSAYAVYEQDFVLGRLGSGTYTTRSHHEKE